MVSFNDNQFKQFHDYLTQLRAFNSDSESLTVTQAKIAKLLEVHDSGVSRFLSNITPRPKKMMSNFVKKYPSEFARWPKDAQKIRRLLTAEDVRFFLQISTKAASSSSGRSHAASSKPTPAASTSKELQVVPPRPAPIIAASSTRELQVVPPCPAPARAASSTRELQVVPPRPLAPRAASSRMGSSSKTQIEKLRTSRTHASPIIIAYRGHQTYRDGMGMLFDHIRIQDLTSHPTVVSYTPHPKIAQTAISFFKSALLQHPISLAYGETCEAKRIPGDFPLNYECGLLIIPGRARAVEHEPFRLRHEYSIIREAINRGQPILAICAGVWRLWNQLIVMNNHPNAASRDPEKLDARLNQWPTVIPAKDHCYSTMIRLDKLGVEPSHDKIIHLNTIQPGSHLQDMMSLRGPKVSEIEVNSVHWQAINPEFMPHNVICSAYSKTHRGVNFQTRQSTPSQPEENIVEAFETIYGAPVIGLQWHPEGCSRKKSSYHAARKAIAAMAQAGDAYFAKRSMLRELESRFSKSLLNK